MRILLDTQVFILGFNQLDESSVQLLQLLHNKREQFVLLFSDELFDQIRRVSRRVSGKDRTGLLLRRIWQDYSVIWVSLPDNPSGWLQSYNFVLPREDVFIFLTGWLGKTDVMVSENHEFVQQAAAAQNLFDCLSVKEFLEKYS